MPSKLLSVAALLAFSLSAMAQAPYLATISTGTYNSISSTPPLVYSATDGGYYFNANFTFKVFNRQIDFKPITTPKNSNGGFMASAGYLANYETPALENTVALQCMYIDSIKTVAGITTAYGALDGAVGNRILKVEWKDAVYGKNNANRVNMQIWLHESDGSISYHYGPNTLANAATINAFCGAVVFNATFSGLVDQFSLSGSLAAVQTTHGGTTISLPRISSIPANGTVITLKRNTTSVNVIPAKEEIALYPNPAKGYLMLTTQQQQKVVISNTYGQVVKSFTSTGREQRVDISNMTPGTYTLRTESNIVKNFVIN